MIWTDLIDYTFIHFYTFFKLCSFPYWSFGGNTMFTLDHKNLINAAITFYWSQDSRFHNLEIWLYLHWLPTSKETYKKHDISFSEEDIITVLNKRMRVCLINHNSFCHACSTKENITIGQWKPKYEIIHFSLVGI